MALRRSENRTIFRFRVVPPLATVCRTLVQRKGQKRATSHEGFPRDDVDRVSAKGTSRHSLIGPPWSDRFDTTRGHSEARQMQVRAASGKQCKRAQSVLVLATESARDRLMQHQRVVGWIPT